MELFPSAATFTREDGNDVVKRICLKDEEKGVGGVRVSAIGRV